jgi:hypothetical protein
MAAPERSKQSITVTMEVTMAKKLAGFTKGEPIRSLTYTGENGERILFAIYGFQAQETERLERDKPIAAVVSFDGRVVLHNPQTKSEEAWVLDRDTGVLSRVEKETWDQILQRHYLAGTSPTGAEAHAQWREITQEMIDREIRRTLSVYPTAKVIWLLPAYYDDGELTVIGSVEMPYSDVRRREYHMSGRWEQSF